MSATLAPITAATPWLISQCGHKPDSPARARDKIPGTGTPEEYRRAIERAKNAEPAVEFQRGNRQTFQLACLIKDDGVSEDGCLLILDEHFNPRCSPPWPIDDLEKTVANAYRYGKNPQGSGSPRADFGPTEIAERPAPEIRAPEYSDDALALSVATGNPHIRHVAKWGQWLILEKGLWRSDETMEVWDLVRKSNRGHARGCNEISRAKRIASNSTVASVVNLLRSDRRIAATTDQWDSDPWLLNTPDCVIDLRSCTTLEHRADHYATKVTAVSPGGPCALWLKVLERITGGDYELQRFLQKIAGYCLTGVTREHAIFFLYGTGGNGKGIFLNTLTAIYKDYATVASIDTFTASSGDRHPTDLAMLRGARLVTAQETEEGRQWAENRIKALTGGDPITARFMRQDFFTYIPQFKLLIAGNHRPGLRSVDEAIRRRFHLIPFDVKIPKAEQDPSLPEKLRAEWPGILQWAIEGCALWQAEGLSPPAIVTGARGEYLGSEDVLGNWLNERCKLGSREWQSGEQLYDNWKSWAERSGEHAGTHKRFTQRLKDRGFESKRGATGHSGFTGIVLLSEFSAGYSHGEGSNANSVFA